jgi:hypothetical protein
MSNRVESIMHKNSYNLSVNKKLDLKEEIEELTKERDKRRDDIVNLMWLKDRPLDDIIENLDLSYQPWRYGKRFDIFDELYNKVSDNVDIISKGTVERLESRLKVNIELHKKDLIKIVYKSLPITFLAGLLVGYLL